MATHGDVSQCQQTMYRSSPSPITGGKGSPCDRNHIRGIVVTSRTSGASTTTAGVIVATAETSRATRTDGNKKPIEAHSSYARTDFYANNKSSCGNVSADRCASDSRCGSERSNVDDESGVWDGLPPRIGDVQKTCSQSSIIVRVQPPAATDALDASSSEDDLTRSVYSQSSTSTVVKRPDRKSVVLIDDRRTDSESTMNELPSYELASGYVKANAYAQLSNSKNCATPNAVTTSGSELNGAVTTQQPYSVSDHGAYSYDKINQYDQSPTSPIARMSNMTIRSPASGQQQVVRESSLEPIGEEELLVQMTQAVMNSQPSRSKRAEILRYFATAKAFQIRVVGGDIQITDSDGCPLFDAYQELDCRQRWWNIEAYGDRVLLMREELSFGDGSSSWGSRVTITDWNGEVFGYLITGDPMRMESVERVAIGRFFSQPAIVNNAACSNATSVPRAYWMCQSSGEDGREQMVARLEAYQRIVFHGDGNVGSGGQHHMNFHLKLMILAGVIRLVGALTVTPVSDCLALTKFFCNCCAYK